MKVLVSVAAAIIYIVVLFYLLMGAFLMGTVGFGIRIGGNLYAEEGFGLSRATSLLLLVVWLCAGLVGLSKISRGGQVFSLRRWLNAFARRR